MSVFTDPCGQHFYADVLSLEPLRSSVRSSTLSVRFTDFRSERGFRGSLGKRLQVVVLVNI